MDFFLTIYSLLVLLAFWELSVNILLWQIIPSIADQLGKEVQTWIAATVFPGVHEGRHPKTSAADTAKDLFPWSTPDERPTGIGRHTVALYLCNVQCIAQGRVASGNAEDGNHHASREETRTGSRRAAELSSDLKPDVHFESDWTDRRKPA